MRSMRITTSMAKDSGNSPSSLDACSSLIFDNTTATVYGYSFFR